MDMDKIIAIGDKVDLKQLNISLSSEDKKVPVLGSRVLDIKPGNVLQLAMPFHEGKVIPLAVQSKHEMCIYAKNGLFKCNVIVIERYKNNNMFYMDVAVYTTLTKVQRREFYRYTYRTTVEYRIVNEDVVCGVESQENDEGQDTQETPWKSSIMLDLSGGGLRLISPIDEKKDSYIQIRFPIRVSESMEMVVTYGHILRSLRVENNPQLHDLRVEFVKMDAGLQEKIVRFIFEEERRNISRNRK